jgi:hypothetical protein
VVFANRRTVLSSLSLAEAIRRTRLSRNTLTSARIKLWLAVLLFSLTLFLLVVFGIDEVKL